MQWFQQRLKLAQDTAKSQQSSADLIRKRFQAGSSSGLDVANAEGQAASTEANIPALKTALAASMHRLSVLTGQQPTALTDRLLASSRIPTPKLPIPVGIPASILLTRPDVRLAERQLAEATADGTRTHAKQAFVSEQMEAAMQQAERSRFFDDPSSGSFSRNGSTKSGSSGRSRAGSAYRGRGKGRGGKRYKPRTSNGSASGQSTSGIRKKSWPGQKKSRARKTSGLKFAQQSGRGGGGGGTSIGMMPT